MSKQIFLIYSLLLIGNCLFSQTRVSKLRNELSKVKNTKEKINLHLKLHETYTKLNIDSSLFFAQEALRLAKLIKARRLVAQSYHKVAYYFYATGKSRKAIQYYDSAISINKKNQYLELLGENYNRVGVVHKNLGNYNIALKNYNKSFKMLKKIKAEKALVNTYNSLGVLQFLLKNYVQAIHYFQKGIILAQKNEDWLGMANAYNNIGECYYKQGKYKEALREYQKVIGLIKEKKLSHIIPSNTYHNIGDVYLVQKKYEKAQQYYKNSSETKTKNKDYKGQAITLISLGELSFQQGEIKNAITYLNQAIQIAKKIHSLEQLEPAYLKLARIYEAENNYKKAFIFFQLYEQTKTKVIDEKKNKYLLSLEIEHELEQHHHEKSLLHEANKLQKMWIVLLASIGVLGVVLIVILYQKTRLKNKINYRLTSIVKIRNEEVEDKNQLLYKQNYELQQVNQELDKFLYNASHFMTAPITSTLGLLSLLKLEEDTSQFQYYYLLIEESLKKLKKYLQEMSDFAEKRLAESEIKMFDAERLIKKIFMEYEGNNSDKTVSKNYKIIGETQVYHDMVGLETILKPVVTNSIQYANFYQKNPFVNILIENKVKEIFIKIEDNGQGIEEEYLDRIFEMFFRANIGSTGAGLGLYIVQQQIKKLDASIRVESTFGEGTIVFIKIPKLSE